MADPIDLATFRDPGPSDEPSQRTAPYVGEVLGGTYRIARKIGAGGMADVYEVEHLRLGSRFAAKVPRATRDDDAALRRFFREARMLANLRSDHVVTVFDVSAPDAATPFIVMELLHGQDLRQLLRSTPALSVERAVKIVMHACLGLIVVHAAGVVHRDLKPENLFVIHRDDGEESCKLLDFGVIKEGHGGSTLHGALIGTLKYMAPEQIESAGRVTPQSDVRSLAVILYECLAGKPPFEADTVERLLYQVLHGRADSVRALRPSVPAELDAVILRALEREPSLRYPSAQAFAEALRPFTRQLDEHHPLSTTTELEQRSPLPPVATSPGKVSRRRGVAFGVALLATGLAWVFGRRSAIREAPPPLQGVGVATHGAPARHEPRPSTVTSNSASAPVSSPGAANSSEVSAGAPHGSEAQPVPGMRPKRTPAPKASVERAASPSPQRRASEPRARIRIEPENPYEPLQRSGI